MSRHAGFRRDLNAGYHDDYDEDDDYYDHGGSYGELVPDSPSMQQYLVNRDSSPRLDLAKAAAKPGAKKAGPDTEILKKTIPLVRGVVPQASDDQIIAALRRANYDVDSAVEDLTYFAAPAKSKAVSRPPPVAKPAKQPAAGKAKAKPLKPVQLQESGLSKAIKDAGLSPATSPMSTGGTSLTTTISSSGKATTAVTAVSPTAMSGAGSSTSTSSSSKATSSSSTRISPRSPTRVSPVPISPLVSIDSTDGSRAKSSGATSPRPALPKQEFETVAAEDGKHRLSIVVVGHVDSGKSTIMGHLLFDLGLVNKKTMHKFEKECKEKGKASFHFAWVLDETDEERERGVTVDIGVTYFDTPTKHVTLLDAPGHKDFVANMITGACQADAAVLVVNAVTGEFEAGFDQGGQTKEHVVLLKSVGVKELLVAVNKMDMCDFDQKRYDQVVEQLKPFLKQTGFKESSIRWVPVAGLPGENLIKRQDPLLSEWYNGPTFIEMIDAFPPPERLTNYPLRFCVSDVFKSTTLGITLAGKIETGKLKVNDKVVVMPTKDSYICKAIERQNEPVKEAFAGDNIEVALAGITDIATLSIGQVVCSAALQLPYVTKSFSAQLLTLKPSRPITMGYQAVLHLHVIAVPCVITKLVAILDKNLAVEKQKPKCIPKDKSCNCLVEIAVAKPICVEMYSEFRNLGRFTLRESGMTIAAGLIKDIL